MARQVGENGFYVHTIANSYLVVSSILLFLEGSALARPISGNDAEGDSYFGNLADNINILASSWFGVVLALSFLIILASLLALCGAGGCCGEIQWFGRTRQEPLSFSNPMTEPGSTMMVPISQIDVRTLELDPIVFEPLPTVHDLTPISGKTYPSDHRVGHSGHRNPSIPIVSFSADDSDVYAHDWFEEPLNNFPRRNIEYVKEIGKGWFGQVIEAEARDIVPFAKKIRVIVKLLREDANGIEQMRFLDESRMYRDGDHGNILKLMGHSIEKLPFLLIMEYCPQGDLKSFLISNVIRAEMLNSQGTIVKMALDVSKGLEWLHNAGFVHPDLAARSCQVGSENRVVIGDYGLGTQNFKDDYHWSHTQAIPLRWTAPETLHCTSSVIQILKVTETSNIWTLGVVMWEICEFGKLPYSELADDEVISRVIIDKNYLLGRPTLPCMAAKEELFKIMSSCWKADLEQRPRLYTIVRELEELHNAFLTSSTSSSKHTNPPSSITSPTNPDEFDSKWEQLAGKTNTSEDDKRRKKNVSFLDLEQQVARKLDFDLSDTSDNVASTSTTPSKQLAANDSEFLKEDPEEEAQWTKKIERGDITQKVLEKSQSVQDLMVLTHFEQSDMGEFDSLLFVAKPSLQNQSSAVSSSTSNEDGGSNEKETSDPASSNSSGRGTLKKSRSEPTIDALSLANSSHTLTPGSGNGSANSQRTLVPQDSNLTPFTPPANLGPPSINIIAATPKPSVEINVIAATPKPPVEINVIQPTPNQSVSSSSHVSSPSEVNPVKKSNNASGDNANKKFHFKFDSSPPSSPTSSGLQPLKFRQRQTSTPLRSGSTPSPRVSDCGGEEGCENEDVFDTTSGYFMEGTFSLSPISQACVGSFDSNAVEVSSRGSSILFGASDDYELGSYQGVKSQIHERSHISQSPWNESEKDVFEDTPQIVPHEDAKPKQRNKENPRRILFQNGEFKVQNEDQKDNEKPEVSTLTSSGYDISSSSAGSMLSFGVKKEETNGDAGAGENKIEETKCNGDKRDVAEEEEDHDAFWQMQLKSLQMAADSTRSLFQTGLHESAEAASDDKRFVEDIEADVEELGSLVLHDLEEPNSLQTIIKETRDPIQSDEPVGTAILAFESNKSTSSSGSANSQTPNDPLQTAFVESLNPSSHGEEMNTTPDSKMWDINNSIELRKGQKLPNNFDPTSAVSDEVQAIGEDGLNGVDEDGEDAESEPAVVSVEFKPSKWNQSLIPSRSAIKSPEQQTQPKPPAMKKSVSFEMKKSHIIYEYPPPPPVSDLEEEQKKTILMGSASSSVPMAASLDWELTQEELEDAEINHEDWDDEVMPKPGDPMDVYRISGFNDDNFQVRCSNEPFVFSPFSPPSSTTLGELRHTRDRLRLDLSRGEANFLDDDPSKLTSSNPAKLDSGVGSSTNVSPFNTDCDILTKRSTPSE